MIEVWKDIKGYEGLYQISNFGRVKSLERIVNTNFGKPKLQLECYISGFKNTYGYKAYNFMKNGKTKPLLFHRLVAIHFIPNPKNKSQVNHIDGNKINNHILNLEWATCKENINHCFKNGFKSFKGEKHNQAKLNNKKVIYIRKSNKTNKELALYFNVSISTIRDVKYRRSWKHI